jgi:hypothetical protein
VTKTRNNRARRLAGTAGVRFLIRSVLHQGGVCGAEEDCPDRVFRCRKCGYSAQTELDGCPACGADWKAIDVSHGPGCPKNLLEEAVDSPNGALVRRCFRLLNAKSIGLTITLADITEEEFRVLELIEAERQKQMSKGERGDMDSQYPIGVALPPP